MLEVCQTLLAEHDGLRVQTHINENAERDRRGGATLFPWAADYLAVYERYSADRRAHGAGAQRPRHPTPSSSGSPRRARRSRTARAATRRSAAASFRCGVTSMPACRVPLGTDVGGGTGFGMLKEGLQAYLMQRVAPDGMTLDPARLLLSGHAGRRRGAGTRRRDRRLSRRARPRTSSTCGRQPDSPLAAVLERVQEPGRGAGRDLHARRRGERARGSRGRGDVRCTGPASRSTGHPTTDRCARADDARRS